MTIKEIRSLTGLTQEEFHKRYDIPKRTIENWESTNGSNPPPYVVNCLERCVKEKLELLPIDNTPIQKLRKQAQMSRAEFSRKYDVPLRTLEDWEAGRHSCPQYVSSLIERCFRHDVLPFYFCVLKNLRPSEYAKNSPGGGNYFTHSQILDACVLENVTAEKGFSSKHKCEIEMEKVRRLLYKAPRRREDLDYEYYIVRAEDLIEAFLKTQS